MKNNVAAGASKPISRRWLIVLAGLLAWSLTGCVRYIDHEASQEQRPDVVAAISPGHYLSIEFTSRRPGLSGITTWMKLEAGNQDTSGLLVAELFSAGDPETPIKVQTFPLESVKARGLVEITFAPQSNSAQKKYLLTLRPTTGRVQAQGITADVKPRSRLFLDSASIHGDPAYQLYYNYNLQNFLADLQAVFSNLWLAIPMLIVLALPGWLLLAWSGVTSRFDLGERIALSTGLSLATIPVLLLWTSTLPLRWTPSGVRFTAGLLVSIFLWQTINKAARRPAGDTMRERVSLAAAKLSAKFRPSSGAGLSNRNPNTGDLPPVPLIQRLLPFLRAHGVSLTLLAVFIFALSLRLIMVRDLPAPPWVDSVHHGLITRLIISEGGLPPSYQPALEIETASYHPGFHSALATFIWLSGLDLPRAMLLFGQVLNALAVLAVYLFTTTLVKNRLSGVIAAFISGVFTPMPAYYTSWGRYTQLAGLLILPAALALYQRLYAQDTPSPSQPALGWRSIIPQMRGEQAPGKILILAGLATAGLFLTHYRATAFFLLLVLTLASASLVSRYRRGWSWPRLFPPLSPPIISLSLALLLLLPWLPATLGTLLIPKASAWRGTPATLFHDFNWAYLTTALGTYVIGLAGLGLLWGLFRRKAFALVLPIWVSLLFALANLDALNLPGSAFVNNISVEITLFMPLSLFGGYFLAQVLQAGYRPLPTQWRRVFYVSITLATLSTAVIAGGKLLTILNPVTFLFRQPDRQAIQWMSDHLPPGERILINPFNWGYGLYAGNDGGYWISALSSLRTIPPPVLYGFSNDPAYIQQINATSQYVMEHAQDPEALYAYLIGQDIHYIYIGARGGILHPQTLIASERFDLRYARDGAWLFELQP